MAKYHINQMTMRPTICRAMDLGRCPFNNDAPHFDDRKEAAVYIERKLEENYSSTGSLKKKTTKTESTSNQSSSNPVSASSSSQRPSEIKEQDPYKPYEYTKATSDNIYSKDDYKVDSTSYSPKDDYEKLSGKN